MKNTLMLWSWALLLGLIAPLALGADPTNAPSANPLDVLRPKYEAMLKEIAARFESESSELPPKYLKAVEAVQMDAQGKGDLQGVVAAKKESTQFALSNTVPAEDEAELAPAIKALRARYRQQAQQLAARRDKDTVVLVQQYCARLAALQKQLTIDGRIDAALQVQSESERVKASKEAQAAIIATYAEPPATAKPEAPAAPAAPPRKDLAASLATGTVAEFGFTDMEARQRSEVLNRLVILLNSRGIMTTVNADRLQVEAVSYEQGVPRYRCRYVPGYDYSRRNKSYNLADATPLAVLQTVCACLGLGYKLDGANNGVVLLDDSSPAAEWVAESTPAEQILKEMATIEGRKRYTGKTIVVTGNPATTMQGLGDVAINLASRVRLVFPRTPANIKKVAEVQTQNAEASKANRESPYARHSVEVTALGKISGLSTALQLALDDCVLLESFSTTAYGGMGPPGQRIIRMDDHPGSRNIRRIGD